MPYKDKEKRLEASRVSKRKHYSSDERWAQHIKIFYKLSVEDYFDILREQNGVCAICRRDEAVRRFHVDHDHNCCPGKKCCGNCVRGLLCGKCNMAIGLLGEDGGVLRSALDYLGWGR